MITVTKTRTRKFRASIVYRENAKFGTLVDYFINPALSEHEIRVGKHPVLGVDATTVKNCRFLMYLRDNKDMTVSSDKLVVVDPEKLYSVYAFLGEDNSVMANQIQIITKLPRGLVMRRREYANRTDAFYFEGFNVLLLAEMPKQIPQCA